MERIIIISLLISAVICVGDIRNCPNYCRCRLWNSMLRIDCVKLDLVNTYNRIPPFAQALDFSFNALAILRTDQFQNSELLDLRYIILAHNRIEEIHRLTFNNLTQLRHLDLSNNNLRHIFPDTFEPNPQLEYLALSSNPLLRLSPNVFLTNVPSLKVLKLANCGQDTLSQKMFTNLESLTELDVSQNPLEAIEPIVLNGLGNLTIFNFTSSRITCNREAFSLKKFLSERYIPHEPFCAVKTSLKSAFEIIEPIKLIQKTNDTKSENVSILRQPPPTNSTNQIITFQHFLQFYKHFPGFYILIIALQVGMFLETVLIVLLVVRRANKRKAILPPPPIPRRTTSLLQKVRTKSDMEETETAPPPYASFEH